MIKWIIFDFGGVLGSDVHEWGTTFRKILELTGLSFDTVNAVFGKYWPDVMLGNSDFDVFWKELYAQSKYPLKRGTLEKIYINNIKSNEQVLIITKNLYKQEFHLAILSNESKWGITAKVKKFRLDSIFEKVYCSAFLGLVKPEAEIFQYVLKDLKATPKEVIFIDDREDNTRTAQDLGMRSILYKNPNQLKRELKDLLGANLD